MKYLLIIFFFLIAVNGWGETELKNNKLYINQEIVDSFERCNYGDGDEVWHTAMLSQQQGFFSSIWLTDKEYRNLKYLKRCYAKYKNEEIEIIVDTAISVIGKQADLENRVKRIEDRLRKIVGFEL